MYYVDGLGAVPAAGGGGTDWSSVITAGGQTLTQLIRTGRDVSLPDEYYSRISGRNTSTVPGYESSSTSSGGGGGGAGPSIPWAPIVVVGGLGVVGFVVISMLGKRRSREEY